MTPQYQPELVIIYDYSHAKMYFRPDGDGFKWDNVFVEVQRKPIKPVNFIKMTYIISPAYKNFRFDELCEAITTNKNLAEKNQFRDHA